MRCSLLYLTYTRKAVVVVIAACVCGSYIWLLYIQRHTYTEREISILMHAQIQSSIRQNGKTKYVFLCAAAVWIRFSIESNDCRCSYIAYTYQSHSCVRFSTSSFVSRHHYYHLRCRCRRHRHHLLLLLVVCRSFLFVRFASHPEIIPFLHNIFR